MHHPGWVLIGLGATIAAVGVVWLLLPSLPWLGRLPGDISLKGPHGQFYFPLATCILLSLLLSGLMWVVRLFSK